MVHISSLTTQGVTRHYSDARDTPTHFAERARTDHPVEDLVWGDDDGRCVSRTRGDQDRARRPGRGAEPGRREEATSAVDRQARSPVALMQEQRALPGDGLGAGTGAEHLGGPRRESAATGVRAGRPPTLAVETTPPGGRAWQLPDQGVRVGPGYLTL